MKVRSRADSYVVGGEKGLPENFQVACTLKAIMYASSRHLPYFLHTPKIHSFYCFIYHSPFGLVIVTSEDLYNEMNVFLWQNILSKNNYCNTFSDVIYIR